MTAFEFLDAARGAAVARSPMEGQALAAGARMEVRDGWNVAVALPRRARPTRPVGWADVSHLRKLEVAGRRTELTFGTATRTDGAWWCPVTRERALVIGGAREPSTAPSTSPPRSPRWPSSGRWRARSFARFCALDLRPQVDAGRRLPPRIGGAHARATSCARTPSAS